MGLITRVDIVKGGYYLGEISSALLKFQPGGNVKVRHDTDVR